jgi:hypothetical protein
VSVTRLVALGAVLAVVLSGCGGGGGDGSKPLSKDDYEAQVGTIAVGLTEAIQEVGAATTVKTTVTALQKCQQTFEQAAAKMEAITPPDDIAAEHAALTKAVGEFGEELNTIIGRVARGNRLAVAGIQALPALAKIVRSSADIGHKGYDLGGG